MNRKEEAKKLTMISMGTNFLLSGLKITSGVVGHSSVIIADGVDSLSDLLITFVAYLGVSVAQKEPDEEHPYGHERFEAIFGKIMAIFIVGVAMGIFYSAYQDFKNPDPLTPTMFPMIVAIISIGTKIALSRYSMSIARKIQADVFIADAKNFQNDSISSIGSLIGIYLAQQGFTYFQPIFTVLIGFFVFRVGFILYTRSVNDLTDMAASKKQIDEIKKIIYSVEGVKSIDMLKTRRHGSKIFVDLEIGVDQNSTLIYSHNVAENVHLKIENQMKEVKHVMVHVNPS